MTHDPRIQALLPALPLLLSVALPTAALAAAATPPRGPGAHLATAEVLSRTLPREYRLDGVVEAVNRTRVSAQTRGQVEEIRYDVDDFVQQGEVILRLRDKEHPARVAQAAAQLKSASARLVRAEYEYARVEVL